MFKYDVRKCECGKFHYIESEKIDKALNENRKILLVCSSCGSVATIQLKNKYEDENVIICLREVCDIGNKEFHEIDNLKEYDSIIISCGKYGISNT